MSDEEEYKPGRSFPPSRSHLAWDGRERRNPERLSRRSNDVCPMRHQCDTILANLQTDMKGALGRLDTVNGNVKKVEEEIAPVRDIKSLSNNKAVAALFVALILSIGGWIYTHLSGLPTPVEMKLLEQHRIEGETAVRDYQAFKAVTAERLRVIEETVKENNQTTDSINETLRSLSARLASTRGGQ